MPETRLKINSQLEKSPISESVPVTNSINEQVYQSPTNANEVLGFDGLTTEFRQANDYLDFATQSEVDNGIVFDKPISTDTLAGTVIPSVIVGHDIATISNKTIRETVTTIVDNLDGTYTHTSEDGTVTVIGDGSLVTYTDTTTLPNHKIGEIVDQAGNLLTVNESITSLSQNTTTSQISHTDETGTVSNAQVVSVDAGNELSVGTDGGAYFVSEAIKIPTPRIWAKNGSSSGTSSTDVTTLSTTGWAIPSIYAQQFSRDTDTWRSLNPVYELLVHKKVGKSSSRYVLSSRKWVHPVNINTITAGKKYASGLTYNSATSLPWQDRRTEWNVDISTVPTQLVDINPHDFVSYNSNDTNSGGVNPILGAYKIDDFKNSFWFPPKRGRSKGNIKMAFSVRIRIDNPDFQAGVPNQEPYLYGEPSNVLVFKPQVTNMWDGTTLDSLGNRVAELYCFNWIASEENINN